MEEDQNDDASYDINEEQQTQQPEQATTNTNTKLKSTKSKKTKKKTDDVSSKENKNLKGIILSITKPSYTLKGRIGRSLRSVHKHRLRYLFRQLVRTQNWGELSGVLSVLLKATKRDAGLLSNRRKYWATLELLVHMGVAKARKIHQVYEIWMKKDYAFPRNKRSPIKGSYDIQLEFILFCLSRGDIEGAYQAVLSVLQEKNVTSDPKANLVAGLTFSQRWYNSIQEEMQLQDSLESSNPIQSGMSGPQQIMSIDQSNGQSAVEVQDCGSHSQADSNTSIRFGKVIDPDEVLDRDANVKMEVDFDLKTEIPEYEDIHMNSVESDQSGYVSRFPHTGNKQFGSVFYARDLETFLLPFGYSSTNTFEDFVSLQRRIKNDNYKAAVKHLQNALHSTPPAFEALLPLIQMLLLGDQVKEAIEEVESVVQSYKAALPFRLKATLLEHFSNEDATKLCICYEDTLKKDPTCSHSLAKLINLHHDGYYSVEKLVEMIAWHLDATYADSHIWKEFASCFIRLAQCDDDRMSSCVDSYGDGCTERVKSVPDMFKDNVSRKNWRSRCRWWLTRHFTQTILASEVASGNVELLAYKAASACHLYGPESKYVVKACEYLKKEKSQERSNLKMHMANAIGFYAR
nr:hypothetical protein [Tanacetum cinerariifolium]